MNRLDFTIIILMQMISRRQKGKFLSCMNADDFEKTKRGSFYLVNDCLDFTIIILTQMILRKQKGEVFIL